MLCVVGKADAKFPGSASFSFRHLETLTSGHAVELLCRQRQVDDSLSLKDLNPISKMEESQDCSLSPCLITKRRLRAGDMAHHLQALAALRRTQV